MKFSKLSHKIAFLICMVCARIRIHALADEIQLVSAYGGTNGGIYATASDFPPFAHYAGKGHCLTFAIHFTLPNTNSITSDKIVKTVNLDQNGDIIPAKTGAPFAPSVVPTKVCKYFRATNLFCGPMELTDAAGHQIPMTKPAVSALSAYPSAYNLSETAHSFLTQNWHGEYEGALLGNQSSFRAFYLRDYFQIEQPGRYQLTVWPKIYRRSATNTDHCERIDLPPVTVPINWK